MVITCMFERDVSQEFILLFTKGTKQITKTLFGAFKKKLGWNFSLSSSWWGLTYITSPRINFTSPMGHDSVSSNLVEVIVGPLKSYLSSPVPPCWYGLSHWEAALRSHHKLQILVLVYSPPSINVTLINVNSLYLLTKSYSPHIAN